jgi:hypothetical protein
MIQWDGPGGELFELRLSGYQFPAITDGWDANWLNIEVRARSGGATWTASCACILTWDLALLEDWLEDLASNVDESWSGLEPDLTLRSLGLSRGRAVVAVELAFGLCNPKPSSSEGPKRDVYVVTVPVAALSVARQEVGRWLAIYPPRGELGERSMSRIRQHREDALREEGA